MNRTVVFQMSFDERHRLEVELVRPLGPTLLRNEPCQTIASKRGLGLIEGRPGNAEQRCSVGLRCAVDADMAQHLVLDLNQVAGVEEVARLEPRRQHPLWMRIQYAETLETFQLRVGLGQDRGAGYRDLCKLKYAASLQMSRAHHN